MSKRTIVIIDNEAPARDNLKNLIQEHLPMLEIVGEAASAPEAIELLRKVKPDIILLDIQLGDQTGFNVLEQTTSLDYQVIFTTAFSEYAIKAIQYAASDYLLKPIGPTDILSSFNRLWAREGESPSLSAVSQIVNEAIPKNIIIADQKEYHILSLDEILRCEAQAGYTEFYRINGSPLLSSTPLGDYEDLLPAAQFFRVHKSHIVRREFICKVEKGDGGFLELTNGDQIPVSRRRKAQLMGWLRYTF